MSGLLSAHRYGAPPPAGVLAFDPSKTNANLTLSNSDKTVTENAAAGSVSALGLTGKNTGKWSFRVLMTGTSSVISVGLGLTTANLNSYAGGSAGSWGYIGAGTVRLNSVVQATYSAYTSGDAIDVAFDADAGKLWFGKNGTWNGNPAAGTGGLTIAAGTWYPQVGLVDLNDTGTLQLGTPPSGFSTWEAA